MGVLDIMILRKTGEGWPVIVQESHSQDTLSVRTDGTLYLDLVELTAQSSARAYGTVLGRALFRDAVAEALIRARARSPEALHVTVMIDDPQLRTLRWERLCARIDNTWEFLRLDQRTPFSLHIPAQTDRVYPTPARGAQRVLVVVASPGNLADYSLQPFDAGRAATTVREALGGVACDILACDFPGAVGPPTLDAICERLTANVYTILHIVAHGGTIARTGETVLYLASEANEVDPVPAGEFIQRLGRLRSGVGLPHLVFLACCETAAPGATGAAGGLALRLAQEIGTPSVVAMTDRVSVATVEEMVGPFFHRLTRHGLVDLALSEACSQMADRADLTVPVLYSRLHGKPLFVPDDEPAPPEPPPLPTPRRSRGFLLWIPASAITALAVLAGYDHFAPHITGAAAALTPPTPPAPPPPVYRRVAVLRSMQLDAGYTPADMRALVEPVLPALAECFPDADRALTMFTLSLAADGTQIGIGSPTPAGHTPELDACARDAFKKMTLGPTPKGEASEIRLGIQLTRVPVP